MKLVKAREEEFKFNTGPKILTITKEGILVDDLTAQMLESRLPVVIEDVEMVYHTITEEDLEINPGIEEEVQVGDEIELPAVEEVPTEEVVEEIAPVETPKKKKTNKK